MAASVLSKTHKQKVIVEHCLFFCLILCLFLRVFYYTPCIHLAQILSLLHGCKFVGWKAMIIILQEYGLQLDLELSWKGERERFSRSIEIVWNLKEKRLRPTQVLSCEFCEIFKTIVFTEHLRATASKKKQSAAKKHIKFQDNRHQAFKQGISLQRQNALKSTKAYFRETEF